jgi:hypothetical protein
MLVELLRWKYCHDDTDTIQDIVLLACLVFLAVGVSRTRSLWKASFLSPRKRDTGRFVSRSHLISEKARIRPACLIVAVPVVGTRREQNIIRTRDRRPDCLVFAPVHDKPCQPFRHGRPVGCSFSKQGRIIILLVLYSCPPETGRVVKIKLFPFRVPSYQSTRIRPGREKLVVRPRDSSSFITRPRFVLQHDQKIYMTSKGDNETATHCFQRFTVAAAIGNAFSSKLTR